MTTRTHAIILGAIGLTLATGISLQKAQNAPVERHLGVMGTMTLQQLCDPSFRTGSVRPSTSYTNALKKKQLSSLDIPWSKAGEFEEDHWYAITAGGSPSDPNNLRPIAWNINQRGLEIGAHTKDRLEAKIGRMLCAKQITLPEVPACFDNWTSCYNKYIGPLPKYGALGSSNEERVE